MELTAVRSFHFRRPSAEALTWFVTAAMLAAGSLLPEPNAGMSITVAQGLVALLPVAAVAAVLAGAPLTDPPESSVASFPGEANREDPLQ